MTIDVRDRTIVQPATASRLAIAVSAIGGSAPRSFASYASQSAPSARQRAESS